MLDNRSPRSTSPHHRKSSSSTTPSTMDIFTKFKHRLSFMSDNSSNKSNSDRIIRSQRMDRDTTSAGSLLGINKNGGGREGGRGDDTHSSSVIDTQPDEVSMETDSFENTSTRNRDKAQIGKRISQITQGTTREASGVTRRLSLPHNLGSNVQKTHRYGKVESYHKMEKLGEGTYATVYKGLSVITGEECALKEIRLDQEEGAPCTAIREASLLRELKHVNIVTLHDIIHTSTTLTFVFEYLKMDLKQYIDEAGGYIDMHNVKIFFFQLLRGLDFCHRKRILHRDLKPQNLLLNSTGELKLADFGLARAKGVPIKTFSNEVVTLWYRPPDVLLGSVDYNTSIDMWSAGCIFAELASGRPLFPGSNNENELMQIFKVLGTPTTKEWENLTHMPGYSKDWPRYKKKLFSTIVPRLDPDGLQLLEKLLVYDPAKRITCHAAMHHPYFRTIPAAVYNLPDDVPIFAIPQILLKAEMNYDRTK
eukprot:Ihof_evm5s42 gene=Ihof_evmTU5s42